jgi:hypothetical protein
MGEKGGKMGEMGTFPPILYRYILKKKFNLESKKFGELSPFPPFFPIPLSFLDK